VNAPAGLLLPSSFLTSPTFLILSTIVAINTIVYVGLTIAKITPWPHQLRPDQTRAALARFGIQVRASNARHTRDPGHEPQAEEPLPLALARTEIPLAFGFLGGVEILFALGGGVATGFSHPMQIALSIAVGAILIFGSVIVGHHRVNPRILMWGWVLVCTAIVVQHVWDSHLMNDQLPALYGLLVMIFAVPVTLAWIPALTGGLLMFATIVAGQIIMIDGRDTVFTVVLAVLALAVAVVQLELRLAMVTKMSSHEQALEAVAGADPVTGSLSRRGILGLAEGLADTAERVGASVFVLMVKIGPLADLNRLYGYEFGDTLMRTAAEVLHGCCHPGDLVGRWTGSRFVVFGVGDGPKPEAFIDNAVEGIRASGVEIGKIPVTVSIGICTADPRRTTFEDMIAAAEKHLKSQQTRDAASAGNDDVAGSDGSGTRTL